MAQRIFALLCGVNDYTPNVGVLDGCLNDVDAYHEYLRENYPASDLAIEVIKDSQVTRQGVIDGFRNHLAQAGPDDVVLFQFAGHGARWKSSSAFNEIYPDGFDEGLVCWDSRRDPSKPGSYDLSDKELAVLVSEVATDNRHVAVILDCCHSGSGTRSVGFLPSLKKRMTHQVDLERPLDSYLNGFYQQQLESGTPLKTPASRHILIAACERKKQAFEGSDCRGIFSSVFLETLNQWGHETTYADLFVRTRARVRRQAVQQTPQFEAFQGFNGRSGFLGNKLTKSRAKRFHVTYELEKRSWVIECGALQGLQAGPGIDVDLTLFRDPTDHEVVGKAKPTRIGLASSELELEFESKNKSNYFAEVTNLPVAPMLFGLSGATQAKQVVLDAQAEFGEAYGIHLVDDDEAAFDYHLEAREVEGEGPCLLLVETQSGKLVRGVRGHSSQAAQEMLKVMDHVATWHRMLNLQNDQTPWGKNQVPFQFVELDANGNEIEHHEDKIRFEFPTEDGGPIRGKLVTQNRSRQPLYSMVLYFSENFGLQVLDNDEFPATENTRTLQLCGEPIFELDLTEADQSRATERFMLVVSNERIDDFLVGPAYAANDDSGAILQGFQWGEIREPSTSRAAAFGSQVVKPIQWFTKTIEFELVRNDGKVSTEDLAFAGNKITVKGHPSLKANVCLTPVESGTRSAGNELGFFRALEQAGLSQLNLSSARGETISALEITNIENHQSLADHPLEIVLDSKLTEEEVLLPLAFDGTHLVVVGEAEKDEAGSTTLRIDSIPETSQRQRSVFNSLKLYFFKAYLKKSGVNTLNWVDFHENGTVSLKSEGVAQRVEQAKKIVLLIPGILGSSHTLATALHPRRNSKLFGGDSKLADDTLVLAYDYENLNTKIEDSANDLLRQIQLLKLGSFPGQRVAIVGNSTGGLLARWIVERGGAKAFVEHVVLSGTPNGGSPLGKIGLAKSIVKTLTTLAINFLPPAAAIGGHLLACLVRVDGLTVSLEDLDRNSEFLKKLNEGSDSGVRYTLLAGNVADAMIDNWSDRLIANIGNNQVISLAFQGNANDAFVSIDSAFEIQGNSGGPIERLTVPCHHFGYWASSIDVCLFKDS